MQSLLRKSALTKLCNADANPDMDTTEIFQQLNRAYEVLKDRDLRMQFDRCGSDGMGNSHASDSTVRSQNMRKPDEVYYHSESNPFGTYMEQPHASRSYYSDNPFQSPPPPPHPINEPRVIYHPPQPPSYRPQGEPYVKDPFNQPWNPWNSPFTDFYNERMASGVHDKEQLYTSPFNGHNEPNQFRNMNTSHQRVQPEFRDPNGTSRRSRTNQNINTGHSQVRAPNMRGSQRAGCRGTGQAQQFMGDVVDFDARPSNKDFRSGTRRRWVGDDLCIEMEVNSETALTGGEEKIRIKRLETCSICDGDGIQPGAEVKTCNHCGGSGAVLHKAQPVGMAPTDNFSGHTVCPHCRGTGQSVAENCGNCHGKGVRQTTKDMTLIIPPGVTDGSKLRLKGEGDAGPMGGPSGDLFVFLKIRNVDSHGTRRP